MTDDIERARSALRAIDPAADRETWVRVSMAAKAAGLDFDAWHEWSANAANYSGESDCRAVWKSINGSGGIGAGTLFALAHESGWREDRHNGHERPHAEAKASSHAHAKKSAPGPDLAAIWASYAPAPNDFGYLVRKGMAPDGLRIASTGARIAGEDCSGWLAVPIWRIADGALQGIQLIAPDGRKLTLPRSKITGGAFVMHPAAPEGRPTPEAFAQGLAYLCEGIATASTAYRASNRPALATFGKGNLAAAARALRERFPSLEIVLCLDRGGEPQAAEIARAIGAGWCELPEHWPANSDLNDVEASDAEGIDEVRRILNDAKRAPERFRLLTAAELRELPAVRWRIHGVLPESGIGAVYGPSGSGKSFLLLDMLAAVARGAPWFAYGCAEACPVTYLAAEGTAGVPQRVRAHEHRHGPLPGNFRAILTGLDIRKASDREDLARAIRAEGQAAGIVVFDTLNRSAPGLDENDAAAMGEVIDAMQKLQAELGGLVLAVAHTGKDSAKGLRGHSSLTAALDAGIEVQRDGDRRAWIDRKVRDGEDGKEHPFRLEVIHLGEDERGQAITSCAVAPDQDPAEAVRRVRLPKGGNQKAVYDVAGELLRKSPHFGQAGAPDTRPCIRLDDLIAACRGRLAVDNDRIPERVRLAVTGLLNGGCMAMREAWLWLP